MWKQLFQVSSFLFVKEILADLRKLTVRCECKKYSFHIRMLWCVRSSCGTLFSCVSHFHAFTGAHEIPVFVYSSFPSLVGYLLQALWFPLLETVMAPQRKCKDTTSAYFVGEEVFFNCFCYVYKMELFNKRRIFAIVLHQNSSLADCLKISRYFFGRLRFSRATRLLREL